MNDQIFFSMPIKALLTVSSIIKMVGNLVIYQSVVGARLGHGWGKVGAKTQIIWGKVGARLGHGWGTGHGWGRVGAGLGHGWGKNSWGKVGARLGQGWGMVEVRTLNCLG